MELIESSSNYIHAGLIDAVVAIDVVAIIRLMPKKKLLFISLISSYFLSFASPSFEK